MTRPVRGRAGADHHLVLFGVCLLVLAAVAVVFERLDGAWWGIDDANIYFVYAKHLAEGHGLVYNVGGERVEGFTSPLWTLVCAVAFAVSTRPERLLLLANVATLTAALAIAWRCVFRSPGEERPGRRALLAGAAFLALTLTDFRYVAWGTVTLMDTGAFSAGLLATTVIGVSGTGSGPRDRRWLAVLAPALLVIRPEAMVWTPVLIGVAWLRARRESDRPTAWALVQPAAAVSVAVFGALTLARWGYFGYPLPNTYYAKVSPSLAHNLSAGAPYVRDYVLSSPVVAAAVLVAAATLLRGVAWPRPSRLEASLFSAVALVGLALPVLSGGDHFGGFRFLQHSYPVLVLALVTSLTGGPGPSETGGSAGMAAGRRRAATALTVAGLLACAWVIREWRRFPVTSSLPMEFELAAYGRQLGAGLAATFADRPLRVAVVAAGGVKLTYPGDIVDLMGLNNLAMAHNGGQRLGPKNHAAFEADTFFALAPDLVDPIWWAPTTERQPPSVAAFRARTKNLDSDPRFQARYARTAVRLRAQEDGRFIAGWYRRDVRDRLEADPAYVVVRW